jgi:hypothetical protein
MHRTPTRLTAWALMIGTVVATVGYLAAFLANGNSDGRFAGSSWTGLYTIALFGDVLIVLGLPAILHMHRDRSRTLTTIGYAGILIPMVVLNIGEGCVEAFVKPYLTKHGGLPSSDLPGLDAFEAPALLTMLVGLICLGIAVFRSRTLPRWVGVLFILSPLVGLAGLSGSAGLASDYLAFAALFAVGVHTLRSQTGAQSGQVCAAPASNRKVSAT